MNSPPAAMPHATLLDTLAAAELALAHFNAHRTSAAEGAAIDLGGSPHWRWLADASRPASAYYSRAIARHAGQLPAEALAELPTALAAVELRPSEFRPDLAAALQAAGFRPEGALCYLAGRPPLERLLPAHPVRRLTASETPLCFDLLESAGTPFPPARRAAKQHYYCSDAFQFFIATEPAGAVLGWSTLFLDGGTAFLGNAFTRPQARGRGVHAALLAARLNAAAQAGVERVFTDVEHGSQSQANCERLGLRTVTLNTLWLRQA